MNHWHLVYTPKQLKELIVDSLPYTRFSASMELGESGRHYHIYIETDVDESTIRDRLKNHQEIPTAGRGKKSLHYSLRSVLPHNPDYPGQDLRKFTLGYTLKDQTIEPIDSITFRSGYTNAELIEAQEYYATQNACAQKRAEARELDLQQANEMIVKSSNDESIQEQWAEYMVFIERALKAVTLHYQSPITISWLNSQSRKYWREKSNGLLPQSSKYKRFLASIIDQLRGRITVEARLEAMKNLGY